jgi:hypothetical protein
MVKGKVGHVQATKACRRNTGIAPPILDVGTNSASVHRVMFIFMLIFITVFLEDSDDVLTLASVLIFV